MLIGNKVYQSTARVMCQATEIVKLKWLNIFLENKKEIMIYFFNEMYSQFI